jgi:ATP:ADP antiporter, AAA family
MRNRVLHFLGVEAGEESMVSLLLYQSVFLGLFYGAFDISAHSLFLAAFDETIMARAYVVSGLAGIVLTTAYAFFQTRMQFKNFAVVNLMVVTSLTLLLWLVLISAPSPVVIFALFVMMGPLNILALLGFWGTTGRLFTLRQGKRLFGLVDAGLIVGIIISSYAIPLILTFGFIIQNIIFLSAVAILCATFMQFRLGRAHVIADTTGVRNVSVKTVFNLFRKDSYVLNIGWYVSLSVMTAFFIQYSFMAVTREQFPLEADMAKFLGLFIGSMMIFTLFLKTFFFSYLIKTYGLKIILLLPPILMMLFTAAAAGLGSVMGYTPASGGFILFFLLLALSRLFSKAVRDSVETPSFKVIYQTLSDKIRYDVQSIVDGTVNEISALVSGLLLSVLGIIVIGKLISFSWVLLAITSLWAFLGFRLYGEYRKSIIRSLDEAGSKSEAAETEGIDQIAGGRLYSGFILRANYPELINQRYTVLENDPGEELSGELVSIAVESCDPFLIEPVKWVSENDRFSKELRNRAKESLRSLKEGCSRYKDPFLDGVIRPEALELVKGTRAPHPALLLRILRDSSPATRRIALMLIARHDITDIIPEVCELLPVKETFPDTIAVLDHFGVKSYGELYRYLMKSSGNIPLMKNLLTLLGKNCYRESEQLIYQMLRTNSKDIRGRAACILVKNGFRIAEDDRDKMHQLISETVGTITWYIQALVVLAKAEDAELTEAVKAEMNWWNDLLFSLLSITYDSQSIQKIRENLETGTVESVNFALEMIDIVLDESIKARVAYCIDISENEEKLRSLYSFYPGFIPSYEDLLTEIINRDYNLSDLWTKSTAIRSLVNISDSTDVSFSLSALLFSPNRLLVEEAVRLLLLINEPGLEEISGRVPAENVRIISDIVNKNLADSEFLTNKIKFLKKRLILIPVDDLIPLAERLSYCYEFSDTRETRGKAYYFSPDETESNDSQTYYRLNENDAIEYISLNPEYLNEVSALVEVADVTIP